MQIFIMRHGEAGLQAASDARRVLTAVGRAQSRQMADWLVQQGVCVERVLVSPYVRATQTLDVLREVMPLPDEHNILPELIPDGDARQVADYLRVLADQRVASVLIVSHLPLVGYLVAELCPQETAPMFVTSSVCCVTLDTPSGAGVLNWQKKPQTPPPG